MQYALINPKNRLAGLQDMADGDIWQYPDGFLLIEAPDFEMDYSYEYADYAYIDGKLQLDPQPKATSTALDDLIAAKVDEAMQASETRLMASMKADLKASKL